VRGFADPAVPGLGDGSGLSILAQPGYPGGFDGDHLYPFHLDSFRNVGVHPRHQPRVGAAARLLERRPARRLRARPHRRRRRRRRAADHGLLHPRRPALRPRPRRRLHRLRPVPLLGARAHRPQPPLHHGGVARPGRNPRRPHPQHQRHPARPLRHAHLHHHAGAAGGAGRQLEGVRVAGRQLRRQRAALFQEHPRQPRAGRQGAGPHLPRHLPAGLRPGRAAAGLVGAGRRCCRASTPPPHPSWASSPPRWW